MYDLAIIGGGPGAVAAGVYAARKKIKTVLITESFGGQSLVSADVQNWIGTKSVPGFELGQMLESHVKAQEGIEIMEGELVSSVERLEDGSFKVLLKSGKEVITKYIFIGSGSRRRRLSVPGEDKFEGKGVVYCSICDAPLFEGKTVAVVGGGNAGLEAVIDLIQYATKIYLFVRGEAPKGDAVTLEKVKNSEKVTILTNAVVEEVLGENFVSGVKYLDKLTNESKELPLEGVFVEVGAVPNTEFIKTLVQLNEKGEIIADPKTQQAIGAPGIWAAGDATDVLYKQNNISAGDAVKAILNIYETIVKTAKS